MAVAISCTSVSCTSGAKAIVSAGTGSRPRANSICVTLTSRGRARARFGQASVTRPEEVILHEEGDGTERAHADHGLGSQVDGGGRRRDHPGGDDERHSRRIPHGHNLASAARPEYREFPIMQRMEGEVDGDG